EVLIFTLSAFDRSGDEQVELNRVLFTPDQTGSLTDSLNHLNESAKQLSNMAELADATRLYLDKLTETTSHLDRFNQATNDLAGASTSLASSYTTIADTASRMKKSTGIYVEQMELLNKNIEGLSRVYTEQLQGITNQVRAISQVHEDLSRLKHLFEGSSQEAEVFKRETERMSEQLTQLNVIYSRMINALTATNAGRPL
ncbi:MAG: gliding motility protein GldL, partial [Bacteroidales bacterium]